MNLLSIDLCSGRRKATTSEPDVVPRGAEDAWLDLPHSSSSEWLQGSAIII